jgi:N-acetylmuramoyl-L-alanine amidase
VTLPLVRRESPNHGERNDAPVDILLLHTTSMASCAQAIDWLANPASQVSAHYVVTEAGDIVAMVPEDRRAWHAGVSAWGTVTDVNSRSIGIEICHPGPGPGAPPYPAAQIVATIRLCRDILARHPIPPERVLAHSDVAPGRKVDPGAGFFWRELHAEGVGHLATPEPIRGGRFLQMGDEGPPVAALQEMLASYGYAVTATGTFDQRTRDVVAAFQTHFRPALVDGVADASTITTLYRLFDGLGPKVG